MGATKHGPFLLFCVGSAETAGNLDHQRRKVPGADPRSFVFLCKLPAPEAVSKLSRQIISAASYEGLSILYTEKFFNLYLFAFKRDIMQKQIYLFGNEGIKIELCGTAAQKNRS